MRTPEQERRVRDNYLRRTYGLGIDDYDRLLEEQGGGCAICGKTPEQEGRHLAVEHNHKTNVVRGIACYKCNHYLIGKHTDPELILRLSEYLRRDTGFRAPVKIKKRRTRASRKKTLD